MWQQQTFFLYATPFFSYYIAKCYLFCTLLYLGNEFRSFMLTFLNDHKLNWTVSATEVLKLKITTQLENTTFWKQVEHLPFLVWRRLWNVCVVDSWFTAPPSPESPISLTGTRCGCKHTAISHQQHNAFQIRWAKTGLGESNQPVWQMAAQRTRDTGIYGCCHGNGGKRAS